MMSFGDGLGSVEIWGLIFLFLLILEVLTADFFILWLSAAALMVAVMLLFLDIVWMMQIGMFSVALCMFLIISRFFLKNGSNAVPPVFLNQCGKNMIGCAFVLSQPI